MISTEVCESNNIEVLDVPTTTVVTTTTSTTTPPITLDTELRGTSSPRISLPKGSPSRPTVTATCRPRTWMQQLTEGQTNEPRREDVSSSKSNTSVVETLPEDIPDELGCEWRVLHLFDLPGVRFPTDTMPPNYRRLAENDALVELIQTTEYLDDVPTWGQRDYRLYPPQYGDPFYRGRGRGGRGERKREWLQERQIDRPNGRFGRGYVQGNNTRAQQQASTDRPQLARQEDGWSSPTNIERREDTERHQTSQVPPSEVPPPTEERLFTDWSSENSPRERVAQCVQSARSVESHRTVNQTEQSAREPDDNEVLRYVLSDVTPTPSAQIQISQVGARFIDRETNTSEVEIRPLREDVRTDINHVHSKGIQVPSSNSELSSHDMNIVESSLARPCIYLTQCRNWMVLFLSVQEEEDLYQKLEDTLQCLEEVILMRVIVTLLITDHVTDEDILKGEDIIRIEVEDHQIKKIIKIEDIQEEEDPLMMEDPLMRWTP